MEDGFVAKRDAIGLLDASDVLSSSSRNHAPSKGREKTKAPSRRTRGSGSRETRVKRRAVKSEERETSAGRQGTLIPALSRRERE